MKIGFDLISDLNLSEDNFDWEGKVTSLFCIVAGNISNDLAIVEKTLSQLSDLYQRVFYIDGALEHTNLDNYYDTIGIIQGICDTLENVVYLHDNIAILNDIAIVGCNGWNNCKQPESDEDALRLNAVAFQDVVYLTRTIQKLQVYNDVEKILVVTSTVPSDDVCFGDMITDMETPHPVLCLMNDTENKVKMWAFGSYENTVSNLLNDIQYVNNGCFNKKPYWAKRIEL